MNSNKVIEFKPKNSIGGGDKKTEVEIKPFDDYKEELKELSKTYNLVAQNDLQAKMISELLMEWDESIRYCRTEQCVFRKGTFVEIIPVFKSEYSRDMLFVKNSIHQAYIQKLLDEGILVEGPGGMLFYNTDLE